MMSATADVIAPEHFRAVLGHLPTGVTVVTADHVTGPVGMCCNSVTSVSLDPPLVAFCAARSSSTWRAIRTAGRCCINVMGRHHESTARRFAGPWDRRFAGLAVHQRPGGPALDDAVAWIDGGVHAVHEAGDHFIVVAGVTSLEARQDAEPLVFFRGAFGGLS